MIEEKIKKLIKDVLQNLKIENIDFVVEHPEDLKNGDYSTNIAMVCAKNLKRNPKELAEKIKTEFLKNLPKEIEKVEEKSGFINFYLSRKFFAESIEEIVNQGEKVGRTVFWLVKTSWLSIPIQILSNPLTSDI